MSGIEEGRTNTVVAIASTNYILCLGRERIVEAEQWIRLIGHAANETVLDDILTRELPHIIIVDTEIASDVPGLIQRIKIAAPQIRIILLSAFRNLECIRQAIDFGVDGIVRKAQPSAVLIATILPIARPPGEHLPAIRKKAVQLALSRVPGVPPSIIGDPLSVILARKSGRRS